MQNTYNAWKLFETLPKGWKIDKTAGSPLTGYEFITNGKSVISGQQRALLKVKKDLNVIHQTSKSKIREQKEDTEPVQIIDEKYLQTVNELARKKFEERLLNDIRIDLMVCEIEGWSKIEYIEELKRLINNLGKTI